jgi:hypothetical protein
MKSLCRLGFHLIKPQLGFADDQEAHRRSLDPIAWNQWMGTP